MFRVHNFRATLYTTDLKALRNVHPRFTCVRPPDHSIKIIIGGLIENYRAAESGLSDVELAGVHSRPECAIVNRHMGIYKKGLSKRDGTR